MNTQALFDNHIAEYEEWYDKYPWVFRSEVEILREQLPEGENLTGIEVGLGTGRFSEALGIKEGVEPSENMRALAIKRGIEIIDGVAEKLPYKDLRFDFVLMNFCISYFDNLLTPFKEAHRVLKKDGALVVGFIDRDSVIGKAYEARRRESTFYRHARFFGVEKVLEELRNAGFRHFTVRQTLFDALDDIKQLQFSKLGHGEGSFVVIKAMKKKEAQLK